MNSLNQNQEIIVGKVIKINNNLFFLFSKRLIDILFALFGLILLIPFMLFISIMIKKDNGPVLFKQKRLGLNGKEFTLIKFRTMVIDAEKNGYKWTAKNDNRITRIGKILRHYRLDELPQLINILKGEMTLVGPRPELKYFYDEFEKYINGFSQRLLVKPGLTGWAQVNGGYDLKPEEKILFDLEYINNQSMIFDLKIIIKTFAVIFFKRGAH